jgi:hypothetical protein
MHYNIEKQYNNAISKIYNCPMAIKRMMKKRGQLTQAQIIYIILAVVCFIILLYFLNAFDFKTNFERMICKNSIMMKAVKFSGEDSSNPILKIVEIQPLKALVPVRCKTEKVVIKTTQEKEIARQIAEQMRQCWWLFDEGQADALTSGMFGGKACLICADITFDKSVQNNVKIIPGSSFYNFLNTALIPQGGKTYLQYLTNSGLSPAPGAISGKEFENIDTKKQYAVIFAAGQKEWAGEVSAGVIGGALGAKALFVVGSFIPIPGANLALGGIGFIAGYLFFSNGEKKAVNEVIKTDTIIDKDAFQSFVGFIPTEDLGKFKCTSFSNIPT